MPDTGTVKKIFNWKPHPKDRKEDPSTDERITLTLKTPNKSHLLFGGIIRSLPFSLG